MPSRQLGASALHHHGARRRRMPRAEREGLILSEARSLFAERGFQDASMDDIAAAAGVTKPMVYAYFGSKEALFVRCTEVATSELIDALERSSSEGPPERRLWLGLLAVFQWVEDNRESWAMLYPAGPQRSGPFAAGLAQSRARTAATLARLLTETAEGQGIAPAARLHLEPMAHALLAATEATAEWWLAHPDEPRDLQVLRLMNFAWQGMGALIEGNLWTPPAGT